MRSKSFRSLQVANSFQGLSSQGSFSPHCPYQEDRREQAYDGEKTRVAWTFAVVSGRRFIHVHDPHSLKSFEAHFSTTFQQRPFSRLNRNHRGAAADVVLQLFDHEFPVADNALDQITNRNNAEQHAIFGHRQMA
jgi:hypothetical protein